VDTYATSEGGSLLGVDDPLDDAPGGVAVAVVGVGVEVIVAAVVIAVSSVMTAVLVAIDDAVVLVVGEAV
jgi:hypothetical protein